MISVVPGVGCRLPVLNPGTGTSAGDFENMFNDDNKETDHEMFEGNR